MIKVISFDVGGTLVNNQNANKYNLYELATLVNIPYEIVRKFYKRIFQKKKGSFSELVNMFCKELNINDNENVRNFFLNKFKKCNVKIDDDTIVILNKLKNKGYKIILFSNCCCLDQNIVNDIFNIVDDIFYSFDIGYTKEEPESYDYIEKKLGYDSNEFLHIGDTFSSDYFYPQKNGWNALYYGLKDNVKYISKLNDVLEYVDKLKDGRHQLR